MPEPRMLGNAAKAVIENDHAQDSRDIDDALRGAEIAANLGNAELTAILTRIARRNAYLVVASGAVLSDDLKRAQDNVIDMTLAEKKARSAS